MPSVAELFENLDRLDSGEITLEELERRYGSVEAGDRIGLLGLAAISELTTEVRHLSALNDRYHMELWARISPSSNLHDSACGLKCRNPSHFPNSDPLEQDE